MLDLIQNILFTILPWLVVLTVVVVVHELGHFLMARAFGVAIDRFSIGFGKTLLSHRDKRGVEWRIAALPLGGYVRFAGDADGSSSLPDAEDLDDLRRQIVAKQGAEAVGQYFHFKPLWQRALVVLAGPIANFVLAVAIFAVLLMSAGEMVVKPLISAVVPGSAADQAGFKAGDLVLTLNGRPLDNFLTLGNYAAYNSGRVAAFTVRRGSSIVALSAAPRPGVRPDPLFGKPMKLGVFGLAPSHDRADYARRRLNPVEAVKVGAYQTVETLTLTLRYIGDVAAGRESGDQLGGPIRILLTSKAMAQSAAASGHTLGQKAEGVTFGLAAFAAVISVSIGFMNLLPIPMLDGGHLLFYAYEAAAHRPVSSGVQAFSYRVGLALVVGLLLFATWNDLQLPILKILGGHVS
jgi:regulator of sigma E protease